MADNSDRANVVVLDDDVAVAREAARLLVTALAGGVALRGEAHIAMTGGSSAIPLYRELRRPEHAAQLDWGRVHLWWGDERLVPLDHPQSNAGLAYSLLLEVAARSGESGSGGEGDDVTAGDLPALPVPVDNIHPYNVDELFRRNEPTEILAREYAAELERYLPAENGLPSFDVVMLGVGPDGHIMSVFPNSPVLESNDLVVAVPAPEHVEPHLARVTLNPRLLPAARLVLVMSSGAAKAELLANVLGNTRDSTRWPAQLARLPQTVWLLDRAAAGKLEGIAAA